MPIKDFIHGAIDLSIYLLKDKELTSHHTQGNLNYQFVCDIDKYFWCTVFNL